MMLKTLFFTAGLSVALINPSEIDSLSDEFMKFREIKCGEFEGEYFVIFADDNKLNARGLSIFPSSKDMTVSMENLNGVVYWDNIESFTYKKVDNKTGVLEIKFFKPPGFLGSKNVRDLKFGILTYNCWNRLSILLKEHVSVRILNNN